MDIYGYAYLIGFALLVVYGVFHASVALLVAHENKHRDKFATDVAKLQIADKYAAGIVANIAVDPAITKSDSKAAAISRLDDKLKEVGITADDDTLSRLVESQYQSYKAAGKDTHVSNAPFSDAKLDEVLNAANAVAKDAAPTEKDIIAAVESYFAHVDALANNSAAPSAAPSASATPKSNGGVA